MRTSPPHKGRRERRPPSDAVQAEEVVPNQVEGGAGDDDHHVGRRVAVVVHLDDGAVVRGVLVPGEAVGEDVEVFAALSMRSGRRGCR